MNYEDIVADIAGTTSAAFEDFLKRYGVPEERDAAYTISLIEFGESMLEQFIYLNFNAAFGTLHRRHLGESFKVFRFSGRRPRREWVIDYGKTRYIVQEYPTRS